MTAGEGPDNDWAVHDCGYAPLLTGGRLVKKHDPAWQLPEVGNGRTNEALQRFVTHRAFHDLAHKQPGYGLGYHHSIHPRGELPGYPDCHMWAPRPGGQMFRELKGMGEKPRPEQVAVLTALAATGADVGVWWPCCWYSGRVDRELAALADARPIGQHWAPGLPPQPGQPGYVPWKPDQAAPTRPPATRRPGGAGPGRRRDRGRADNLAPRTPGAPRPPAELPGADLPDGFPAAGAVGYVVPMPRRVESGGAAGDLDRWLRDHGFPPVAVPFPVRLVVAGDGVAVQCRPGGYGTAAAWRWAPLRRPLGDDLVDALDADVVLGPGRFALELIGDARPSRDVPAT